MVRLYLFSKRKDHPSLTDSLGNWWNSVWEKPSGSWVKGLLGTWSMGHLLFTSSTSWTHSMGGNSYCDINKTALREYKWYFQFLQIQEVTRLCQVLAFSLCYLPYKHINMCIINTLVHKLYYYICLPGNTVCKGMSCTWNSFLRAKCIFTVLGIVLESKCECLKRDY